MQVLLHRRLLQGERRVDGDGVLAVERRGGRRRRRLIFHWRWRWDCCLICGGGQGLRGMRGRIFVWRGRRIGCVVGGVWVLCGGLVVGGGRGVVFWCWGVVGAWGGLI